MAVTQFGGWPFGVDLDYLLNEVKVHARLSSSDPWKHLGDTAAYRHQIIANIINRAMDEYREKLPILNNTTTTQALTADTAKYDIPSDLHGTAIQRAYWSDSDGNALTDLADLNFLTPAQVEQLPASWRNGEYTVEWPESIGFDPADKTQYQLFPTPGSATPVLTLLYRKEPRYITGPMLTTLTFAFADPNFTLDDASWTEGTGWSVGSGVATFTGVAANLTQAITASQYIPGQTWRFEYDVTVMTGSVATIFSAIGDFTGSNRTTTGHFIDDIEINYDPTISLLAGFTAAGTSPTISVDNPTMRQILSGVMERHQRLFALRVAMDVLEPENYERRGIIEVFYDKEMRQAQKTITRDIAVLHSGTLSNSRGNSHVAKGRLFGGYDTITSPRRRR
jgi:hypothetical protein